MDLDRQELEKIYEQGYGFYWKGKGQAVKDAENDEEGFIDFYDGNLYIEGDNLIALKRLQKEYKGKIKMIYIDPPYNTKKKFIYNDIFTKRKKESLSEGDRLHSNWLNMIYPRLKIARDLLTDDGVVFISIGCEEYSNLKNICDEIFQQNNLESDNIVIVKTEGRRYRRFAKTHEYFLVYSKNSKLVKMNEINVEGKKFKYEDEKGGFNIQDLRNQNARAFNSLNRPNLRYPFYADVEKEDENKFMPVSLVPQENFVEVWAITTDEYDSVWRWGKEKAQNDINEIVARKSEDGYRIFQKKRKLTEIPKTVWINKNILSQKGTKEIKNLFGKAVFDFSKPLELLKKFLYIGTSEDSIILDFFSGSATTAHAVMQLNAEDGGNRKYIMVQLPEVCDEKSEAYKAGYKNICEIGKERIRRAGEKIKSDETLPAENREKLDIGFKVIKL